MKTSIAILFTFLIFCNISYSQDMDNEFIIKSNYAKIVYTDNGFISITTKGGEKSLTKEINYYDVDFKLLKSNEFTLDDKKMDENPEKICQNNGQIYLLYHSEGQGKIQVVAYNIEANNVIKSIVVKVADKETLKFEAYNNIAYIATHKVSAMHWVPLLYVLNIKTGTLTNIDIESKTRTTFPIQTLTYNEVLKEVNMLYLNGLEEDGKIEVMRFGKNGTQIKPSFYINEPTGDKVPVATYKFENENTYYVFGKYKAEDKMINLGRYSTPAFFISKYENNKQSWIKYYNLMDFENFRKFDEGLQKYNAKDKQSRIENQIFLHKPLIVDDALIFIGESYVHYYANSIDQTGTASQGGFTGYKTTHSVVFSFDKNNGERKWDVSFKSGSFMESKELIEHVRVVSTDEDIVLLNKLYIDKKCTITADGTLKEEDIVTKAESSNSKEVQNDINKIKDIEFGDMNACVNGYYFQVFIITPKGGKNTEFTIRRAKL